MCGNMGSGGSSNGKAAGGAIPKRLQGVQKFKEYEKGWDSEFKQAVGNRLYKKLENAQSTQAVVSALESSGFKRQTQGVSGLNNERRDIYFVREQNEIIEGIAVTTRTRWENGERFFWFDSASYSWHKLGD